MYFLKKNLVNWKNWNPKKLQTKISTPLRTSVNKKRSSASINESDSINSDNKKLNENDVPSAFKGTVKKKTFKRK